MASFKLGELIEYLKVIENEHGNIDVIFADGDNPYLFINKMKEIIRVFDTNGIKRLAIGNLYDGEAVPDYIKREDNKK